MLYIVHLIVNLIWMVTLVRKGRFSWHSIIATYVIAVVMVDIMEVLINLLLGFYIFPTHLLKNPTFDNQLGIIFADTLILPSAAIIFVYYNRANNPWKITILFTIGYILLELLYLQMGYVIYNSWNTIYSTAFYLLGFRLISYLAPRIVSYNPPVPYLLRITCFAYTAILWYGAIFGMPILKWYQFKTGLFDNFMADDRFVDISTGIALAIMCGIVVLFTKRRRLFSFALIALFGVVFAMYGYSRGWLIYHNWNHLLMVLRYLVPFVFIILYDRWETEKNPASVN